MSVASSTQSPSSQTRSAAPAATTTPANESAGRASVQSQLRSAGSFEAQEQLLTPPENAPPAAAANTPPARVYRAIREYTDPNTGNFVQLPNESPVVVTPDLRDPANSNYDHARAFNAQRVKRDDCGEPLTDPSNGNWIFIPRFGNHGFVWAQKEGDTQPMIYRAPEVRQLAGRVMTAYPPAQLVNFAALCRGLDTNSVLTLRPTAFDPAVQDLLGERSMDQLQDYYLQMHSAAADERPRVAQLIVDMLKPQADAFARAADQARFGTIEYACRGGESHNGRALRLRSEISDEMYRSMEVFLNNHGDITRLDDMPQPLRSVCQGGVARTAFQALDALQRARTLRPQADESPAHVRSAEAARINTSNAATQRRAQADAEYEAQKKFFDALGVRSRTNRAADASYDHDQAMTNWNSMLDAKRSLDAAIASGRMDHLSAVEIEAQYVALRGQLPHASAAIEADMRHWAEVASESRSAQRNVRAANQENNSARAKRDQGAARLANAQVALDSARALDIPCVNEAADNLAALVEESKQYRENTSGGMDATREHDALMAGIATAEGVLASARSAVTQLGDYVTEGNQALTDFRSSNRAGMTHVTRAGSLADRALAGAARVDGFLDILEGSPFAHGYRSEIAQAREHNASVRQAARSAYATSQSLRGDLQRQQVQGGQIQAGLDEQGQRHDAATADNARLDAMIHGEAQAELAAITVKADSESQELEGSLELDDASDFDKAVSNAIEKLVGDEPGNKVGVNLKVNIPIAGVKGTIEIKGSAERLEGGGMKITLSLSVGGEVDVIFAKAGLKITGTLEGAGDSVDEAMKLLLLPLATELEQGCELAASIGSAIFGDGYVAARRGEMDDDDFARGAVSLDAYLEFGDAEAGLGGKVEAGAEVGKKYEKKGDSTYHEERLAAELTVGPMQFSTEWKRNTPAGETPETEYSVKGKLDLGMDMAHVVEGLADAVKGKFPDFDTALLTHKLDEAHLPGLESGGAMQLAVVVKEKDGKVSAEISLSSVTKYEVKAGIVEAGFERERRLGTLQLGDEDEPAEGGHADAA